MTGSLRVLHIEERHEEGDGGFRSLIFVHAIRMKAISAASGDCVVERDLQVVLSEKPAKGRPRFVEPELLAGDLVRLETGSDGRAGLDRLLIEARLLASLGIKTSGADGHEDMGIVAMLLGQQPAERLAPDLDHPLILAAPSGEQECLRQSRVGVSEALLKPLPGIASAAVINLQQAIREQIASALDHAVSGKPVEIIPAGPGWRKPRRGDC